MHLAKCKCLDVCLHACRGNQTDLRMSAFKDRLQQNVATVHINGPQTINALKKCLQQGSESRRPEFAVNGIGLSVTADDQLLHTGELDGNAWNTELDVEGTDVWIEFEFPRVYFISHVILWNFMSWCVYTTALGHTQSVCIRTRTTMRTYKCLRTHAHTHRHRLTRTHSLTRTGWIRKRTIRTRHCLPSIFRTRSTEHIGFIWGACVICHEFQQPGSRNTPESASRTRNWAGRTRCQKCTERPP